MPGAWKLALPLLFLAIGFAPAQAQEKTPAQPKAKDAPKSVVLIQESNGFPGGEKKSAQLARQEVWIQGGNLRILDRANFYGMFIDLKKKEVYETSFSSKEYYRREFSYYEKYRKDRQKALADQRDEFVRGLKRRSGKELKEWRREYRLIGGDPDKPGRIRATLTHLKKDQKKVKILVDREPKEVTLEHYQIRENQAKKPIFDLWLTKDLDLPVELFRFYQELGTFSKPVTEALMKLEGTIVSCNAVLDTGTFHRMFRTTISDDRSGPGPGAIAFVPKEPWKVGKGKNEGPVVPKPEGGPKAKHTCAVCGKPITGKPTTFREPWGKRRVFVLDGQSCRKKLVRKLIAERKRGKK